VDDAGKRRTVAVRVEAPHVGRRRGPHHREHALDRLQHTRHAPERERGGDERDDLPIVVSREAPDDLNGIGGRIGVVELGIEPVQLRFQPLNLQSAI